MFKTFSVSLVLAICACPAYAATHYESLHALFNAGQGLGQEVRGWHSGRCYDSSAPDKPLNNLLVVWDENDASSDGGPLFPGNQETYLVNIQRPDKEPGYFDAISPEKVQLIKQYLHSVTIPGAHIYRDGSMIARSMEAAVSWEVRFNFAQDHTGYFFIDAQPRAGSSVKSEQFCYVLFDRVVPYSSDYGAAN